MRRLLYIAFRYPPWNGPGIHRAVKFVRYLPQHGWEPIVLAARLPGPLPGAPVPTGEERVYRAFCPFPLPPRPHPRSGSGRPAAPAIGPSWTTVLRRSLFTPDPQVFWLPAALPRALQIVHAVDPSAIMVGAPPYSAFLLGWLLKRTTGIPLLLDYRDLWNDNPWYPVIGSIRRKLTPHIEARIISGADRIVVNHDPMRRALTGRFPEMADRCVAIPNGFDRRELGPPVEPVLRRSEPFRIVYAGALYTGKGRSATPGGPPSLLTPAPLFKALRRLADGTLGDGRRIEIDFFGASRTRHEFEPLQASAERFGLGDCVRVHETIPKSDLVPHLRAAHLLLLFVHDTGVAITQKLYDYMHLQIPVLALIRNSEPNAALMRHSRCGVVVDPDDDETMHTTLVEMVRRYESGTRTIEPDRAFIDRFDVDRLTRALSAQLEGMVHGRRAAG